jgi:hypothetical protein
MLSGGWTRIGCWGAETFSTNDPRAAIDNRNRAATARERMRNYSRRCVQQSHPRRMRCKETGKLVDARSNRRFVTRLPRRLNRGSDFAKFGKPVRPA